jgi:hypothetical protein
MRAVMRRQLLLCGRAILLGWAALLVITYLLQRPLLLWTGPWTGPNWFPTERLGLNCLTLAATGWIIGRWHRTIPILAVLAFAATLTFRDFGPDLAINVPWLIHLAADAFRDSAYLESLGATAAAHILMFGSLIAGGLLSRPSQAPMSIVD